jgi:hypothetical protein
LGKAAKAGVGNVSILALLLVAQAPPQITSEPLGEHRHTLQISPAPATVEAAQAALIPTARKLCGTSAVSFGTFRYARPDYKATEPATSAPAALTLDQELFCGNTAKIEAAAVAAPGWQPSPSDQQAVLAATYTYFAAKDRAHYADAWAMLSKTMKGASPIPAWRRVAEAFNSRSGPVRARRVSEITWYNNPPEAAQPGLYVAADFSAEFEKLDFVCGYVMWMVQPDGSLLLTREEQNLFDRARAKSLASIDREPLRAQMGCKD